MKYIGNKTRLLDFIYNSMMNFDFPTEGVFIDLFSGTTSVSQFFKKKDYSVISNDFMNYSFVMQKTYIENNLFPKFENLKSRGILDPFEFLNNLIPTRGYSVENYAPSGNFKRQYFTDENAGYIDSIRDQIQIWFNSDLINEIEFYTLLSSLIDASDHIANMSGTYGAYLKIWRSVALKKLYLKKPEIFNNKKNNRVFQEDANSLISNITGDILYLDPPYNSRQYASNFHVLESISVWDKQNLKGKTGLRDYSKQKSDYSSKSKATVALKNLIGAANVRYIGLSYNNEGIIDRDDIISILSDKGSVREYTLDYRRFRTERDHEKRKYKDVDDKVTEHLYLVKVSSD